MRSLPRLSLADTLVELLESLVPADAEGALRIRHVALDLPLEVAIGPDGELLGNARRWRWPTDFDERPSRLAASFHMVEPS
jgi:hypothetical protein